MACRAAGASRGPRATPRRAARSSPSSSATSATRCRARASPTSSRTRTGGGHHAHDAAAPPREQVTADYRVRVAYATLGAHEAGHAHEGAQSQHAHGSNAAAPAGHLMVFVTDAVSGEPMPYLPVSATIQAGKAPARTVKLTPMVGGRGFHYGADVALPADTSKVTVAIGKPTIAVMGRPARAATSVTFEWRP